MKRNYFTYMLQAVVLLCTSLVVSSCDDIFASEDNPIASYLSMSDKDVTIKIGDTYKRTAIAVSDAVIEYSSSDETVATVDNQGTVKGVAAGTATITAKATGYSTGGKKIFIEEEKSYTVTVLSPVPTMQQTPLTFEAAVAGAIVTFIADDDAVAKDIEYSIDGGTSWIPGSTNHTAGGVSVTLTNVGDKVMFRGTNATYVAIPNVNKISCTADCYIYGNIMSLINKEDFENVTTFTADWTFGYMFINNTHIKNHATDQDKYLVLPAEKLTDNCYVYMFKGCTGLTKTPVINVDCDGKSGSLQSMFEGCTELTKVADGSKIYGKIGSNCCWNMFSGCSKLTNTPVIDVDCDGQYGCVRFMFENCTELTKVADDSKIWGNMGSLCCSNMFKGCSKLASVPSGLLPATTLGPSCYENMFNGCAKLLKAPKLPAETSQLVDRCYYEMFLDCTLLNEAWVKADYVDGTDQKCYNMFNYCATGGVMHTDGNAWAAGVNLPSGWTVIGYDAVAP